MSPLRATRDALVHTARQPPHASYPRRFHGQRRVGTVFLNILALFFAIPLQVFIYISEQLTTFFGLHSLDGSFQDRSCVCEKLRAPLTIVRLRDEWMAVTLKR